MADPENQTAEVWGIPQEPHFHNPSVAREFLEHIRWPAAAAICPFCQHDERVYRCASEKYRCGNSLCRRDFSVTIGTVMERSHIPLHKWMRAFWLFSVRKSPPSNHRLGRILGITYKSAWHISHRLQEVTEACLGTE